MVGRTGGGERVPQANGRDRLSSQRLYIVGCRSGREDHMYLISCVRPGRFDASAKPSAKPKPSQIVAPENARIKGPSLLHSPATPHRSSLVEPVRKAVQC